MSQNRIVGTKRGWLIASTLIKETEKTWTVKYLDENTIARISKADTKRKVFLNCEEAMEWIDHEPS